MKKGIFVVLIILLIGVFLFSGWKVFDTLREYRIGDHFYRNMEQYVSIPEPEETKPQDKNAQSQKEETTDPTAVTEPTEPVWPEVDFAALREINSDVVGWIYIPGTRINYPILHGDTNDTYLYHLMTGEYNSSGSIFLDANAESDFSSQNSPIHGHHMKNGTMFADIADYRDQNFYEAHPVAMLLTPEGNYYVRIFSGYVTDAWDDVWNTAFSKDAFAAWLRKAERQSYFTADVVPTTEDRIVTFSTCTYEYNEARFVVHGVLEAYVPEAESAAE